MIRLEKLGWKTRAGQAKVLGTLIGIGGAMLLTFYKGLEIKTWSIKLDFKGQMAASQQHQQPYAHILGPILSICCCLSSALSLILQVSMQLINLSLIFYKKKIKKILKICEIY